MGAAEALPAATAEEAEEEVVGTYLGRGRFFLPPSPFQRGRKRAIEDVREEPEVSSPPSFGSLDLRVGNLGGGSRGPRLLDRHPPRRPDRVGVHQTAEAGPGPRPSHSRDGWRCQD